MSLFGSYTHPPLASFNDIRLLEFPTYVDQREPLQGTLRVVDIEDLTVPYVALSYTWGHPNFTENLWLDGNGILGITPTLAAALRHFRHSSALRWIWVDAICINQQDKAEKTMQIPLMGNIYRGASRVLVWLGDRAEDIALLRQIKGLVGRVAESYDNGATANKLVTSMSQLGCLALFSRRWIIQELVLNLNAVLCCGLTELPWSHLAPASQVIGSKRTTDLQNIRLLWGLWQDIAMPMLERNEYTAEDSWEARHCGTDKLVCSAFECLDGRDRIAALIGLSTVARRSFIVNYADDVEQTFISFAEDLARSGHMAWLIYQSSQRRERPRTHDQTMPSWVPDLRAAILIHDQNSKLDTDAYMKSPCDIQMCSASPSLHLLTAKFLTLVGKAADSGNSSKLPVNMNPALLQVVCKSVLFPKEADLAVRHEIRFELLLWLFFFLTFPPHLRSDERNFWFDANRLPVIPDFSQDANGLDTLRSFY